MRGMSFHAFRQTHILILALEGGNGAAIAARAGHADAISTKRRNIAPLDIQGKDAWGHVGRLPTRPQPTPWQHGRSSSAQRADWPLRLQRRGFSESF